MKEYLKAQNKTNEIVTNSSVSTDELHRLSRSDFRWADNRTKSFNSLVIKKGEVYQIEFGKNYIPEMSYEHRGLIIGIKKKLLNDVLRDSPLGSLRGISMAKYQEAISDNSLWITATPAPFAKTLPFFISEAGHFIAKQDYQIQRTTHDSFLLLYTINGQGSVQTGETVLSLPRSHCAVIDCHTPHEYHTASEPWEFLWIHFNGNGIAPLFEIAYPNRAVRAVCMENAADFEKQITRIIGDTCQNDVAAYLRLSSQMHSLFNAVCLAALTRDTVCAAPKDTDDVRAVIRFIEQNYAKPITVDDMIKTIPVSKYHFIRRFGRAIGITPYSYLIHYRITVSKTLLRTTDKTVAEIAEACGFLDTNNFIAHFKKHTGQKPLQYRRDFS